MGRSPWVWGRRRAPPAPPSGGRGAPPPLPALGATLGRLLGALEALVAPSDRDRAQRLVRDFGAPGGAGPRLQERLRRQPPAPPRLPEWPWDSSERLPLPVHTSVGLVLPRQDWEDWRGQLGFAARFVAGVLDFRQELQRRDPPEPWLQAAFGGCRVPGPHRDEVLRLPPSAQPPPRITVSRNGQFFQVEASEASGSPRQLLGSLMELRSRSGRGGTPPVGLLTGQHRRAWGRAYGVLMRDRLNRSSLGRIQRSLLALSLDSAVMAAGRSPGGGAAQILHGGGAGANSGNRWFDKTLQVVVGEDGTCGVVYDPAVMDGAVVAAMVDHALDFCRRPGPALRPPSSFPSPERLRFSLSPEIGPEIERAKRHLDSLAADTSVLCFSHEGFGATPRARELLQVALQAAFHSAHGRLCASCEPTALGRALPGGADLLRPPEGLCAALATALRHAPPPGGALPEELQMSLLREAVEEQARRRREVRSRSGSWLLRGPLVPDGYGVGVTHVTPPEGPPEGEDPPPGVGGLRIAITSFNCCHETHAERFGGALKGVLDLLGGLLRRHGPL
ncbi:carnitine O-acetyltransferase-like isoform X2 [Cuculus canorus]|uniref:carnitine O-acetyltransferase-like isoform X2 n=1 Tax=Cuculus canorus TaxID=55661 RepID=UPI0023AAF6BC|nr:carnitine O-acetyltransferase-like isoform X2 [Cuculus canorus]